MAATDIKLYGPGFISLNDLANQLPVIGIRSIRGVTEPTTLLQTDDIVALQLSTVGTITLPDVTTRTNNGKTRSLVLKKRTNSPTITIQPQSGQTVDGQSGLTMQDDLLPSLTIIADPIVTTNWMIIS